MIELIIINSLIIWGVYASIQPTMIFRKYGYFLQKKKVPDWLRKPLGTCPVCMASIYGTPVFWLAYFTDVIHFDFIIFVYICYVFALSGLNYLILMFISE